MKITTRIALGLALLTGLTVAVLAYQLRTVQNLQSINEELSLTNLEAARVSIRLVQELEGVREFASKSLVLEDPGYVEQWTAWEQAVEEDLSTLGRLQLGPIQRQALRDVELAWDRYLVELAPLRDRPVEDRPQGENLATLLDRIDVLMDRLRAGAEEVIEANQAQVARQAEVSALASQRAARISWFAAVGAGILGLLICAVLYLSISGPLRRLTRGTREISEGRFQYRLPADGRDELSELARDFNRMAEKLDELEDMKRDFVSHVSHELKGPLAGIHETILVLLDQIPGPLNEKQEELLTLSRQSATRLSGMITNLLEISRIESGALKLDAAWTDPLAVVREVEAELAPLASGRRLKVKLGGSWPSDSIYVDEERFREVVGNLMGNAIKFSPPGEPIQLRVDELATLPSSLPEHHGDRMEGKPPFLLLEVDDAGPGIPPEHREGVFQKFYQVKRGVRLKGQGVGLGLAICRKVIQAHGGAIWVEESPRGGALFRVLLPRIPEAYERQASDPEAEGTDAGAEPLTDPGTGEGMEEAVRPRSATVGESAARANRTRTGARTGRALPQILALIALVGLLALTAGCGHFGLDSGSGAAGAPEPAEEEAFAEEYVQAEVPETLPATLLLEQADQLLYDGHFQEAERTFVRYLESQESGPIAKEDHALWGLALLHLLPESPLQDRERARTFLERLATRHPDTVRGAQARWVGGILDELEQVRAQVGQQEALLDQLTETVEQLRRIDLNRRPGGTRSDSISRPPRPGL